MEKIDGAVRRAIKARSRAAAARHYGTSLALLALWWAALVGALLLASLVGVLYFTAAGLPQRDPVFLTLFPALLMLAVITVLSGIFFMPFARLAQGLWRQESMSVLRAFAALRGRGLWNGLKMIGALSARVLLWTLAATGLALCAVPLLMVFALFGQTAMAVAMLVLTWGLGLFLGVKLLVYWTGAFLLLDDPALESVLKLGK